MLNAESIQMTQPKFAVMRTFIVCIFKNADSLGKKSVYNLNYKHKTAITKDWNRKQ